MKRAKEFDELVFKHSQLLMAYFGGRYLIEDVNGNSGSFFDFCWERKMEVLDVVVENLEFYQ